MQITQSRQELAKQTKTFHPLASINWKPDNIPSAIKATEQWLSCYLLGAIGPNKERVTTPKRPMGGPTNASSQKSFGVVQQGLDNTQQQHFGFCFGKDDSFVALDVDNLPPRFTFDDLAQPVQDLLRLYPTYAELSPSGQGLHIVYQTNKELLKHRKAADKGVAGFEGALYVHSQFLTFTGHKFNEHTLSTITPIEAATLERLILAPAKVTRLPSALDKNPAGLSVSTHTFEDLEKWINVIPQTLSASPLKDKIATAYKDFDPPIQNIDDYTHWQYIAAALHQGADAINQTEAGADLFDMWSASDSVETNYTTSELTIQKYYENPPKYDGSDITYLTLAKLYYILQPAWKLFKTKLVKGRLVKTLSPDPAFIGNWKVLTDHYAIQVAQNNVTKRYRVDGFPQVIKDYFRSGKTYNTKESLESCVLVFAQNHGFPVTSHQLAKTFTTWWLAEHSRFYNPIKEWIDSAEPLKDDGISWFQTLWETIELSKADQRDEDLFKKYLKMNLMGLIRAHYYTGEFGSSTGVVILQGGENTYKSTWVRGLLPQNMSREYIGASQCALKHDSIKELQIEAGQYQILLFDEIERIMKGNDSQLKNFLVQDYDLYRPLYSKSAIQARRRSIFFGTTNRAELPISDDGSRRIQIIPVKLCDTTAQRKIPMVKVYQELLAEFNSTPVSEQAGLWTLDSCGLDRTNDINATVRKAESDLDHMIKEAYDYSYTFDIKDFVTRSASIKYVKNPQAVSFKDVRNEIAVANGVSINQIGIAQLKHVLKRQYKNWAPREYHSLNIGSWVIDNGYATLPKFSKAGVRKGNSQSKILVPPTFAALELAAAASESLT